MWGFSRLFPTERDVNNAIDYIEEQYKALSKIGLSPSILCGCTVLEVGPYNNLSLLAKLLKIGAKKAFAVDIGSFLNPVLNKAVCERYGISRKSIQYLPNMPIEELRLPSNSIDIVYSINTLEHVYDPVKAVTKIHQVLRRGGCTFHIIDLTDHLSDEPLGFLKIPQWLWRIAYYTRMYYTNRLRASDWQLIFKSCGFTVVKSYVLNVIDSHYIEKNIQKFIHPFRAYRDLN
jgi:SAM-dependent methyltransferase